MSKTATGELRYLSGVWSTRITLRDNERATFKLPTCTTEAQARTRSRLLATIAKRLAAASVDLERMRMVLERAGIAASDRALRDVQSLVDELAGGKLKIAGVQRAPTFQELGEQWTSGKLAKRYPDQIRVKRSADNDVSRLTHHVYPIIGKIPVDQITLDACESVMRRLPADMAVATRRNTGQLITRLLSLAVYPCRLIPRSPIPPGFLPTAAPKKALAYLYPDEDRRLMACIKVPLEFRLLYGFLTREGTRSDEATSLTWSDLDLERGAIRLDKNKTNDPRAWALSPGVAETLRILRDRRHPKPTAHVFLRPEGMPMADIKGGHLAQWLRKHLRVMGLHHERPELFATTAERRQIRAHDLRGTFVTVSLANGRSESWISDRTGHRSSVMIATYKRNARTFGELNLGDLTPLHEALPEFFYSPVIPPRGEPVSESAMMSASSVEREKGFENGNTCSEPLDIAEKSTIPKPPEPPSSAQITPPGNNGGIHEAFKAGLAAVVGLAAAAQEWEVVTLLSQELAAVRAFVGPEDAAIADALRLAGAAEQWATVKTLAGLLAARRPIVHAHAGDVIDLGTERQRRR